MNNSADELKLLYRNRFNTEFLSRKRAIWRVLTADFIQKFIPDSSTLLDLASGYGEFINEVTCQKKMALDLNPDTKAFLNEDVKFINKAAHDFSEALPHPVDRIFSSNFFEHLPDKAVLTSVLKECHAALSEGGKLIAMGPNLRCVPGRYWDFYDHHIGLTDQSLCEALRLVGFEVEHSIARFMPFSTQSSLPTHPIFVKLYLKLPFFWRLFGKQFFIVAVKPKIISE